MGKRAVAWSALIASWLAAMPAWAGDSAVVLAYHRFDDERIPALSTRTERLGEQLAELKAGGHVALPLDRVVDRLLDGGALPDKAVVIMVDEATIGFLAKAWPLLRKAGVPVALAVATDEADRGGEHLGWNQLRDLAQAGVTLVSEGAARLRMGRASQDVVAADLEKAAVRFKAELGFVPSILVWPGGEASVQAMATARRAGYRAAFGQQSGVAWTKGEPMFLPRFAATAEYGEPERFRTVTRALPLPAVDITPADPLLTSNPPAFGFTLEGELPGLDGLACFASHQGKVKVERLGPRVEVRMVKPFPPGRGRLNCTLTTLEGRWRWFGWQFVVN